MLLITIKLVFKIGFWDGLQYFDFFEAFPRDRRQLWSVGGSPCDGLPGGVQSRCHLDTRYRAIFETAEGVPCRFRNFYQIFSLLMLLVLRNNIPALNDESHH